MGGGGVPKMGTQDLPFVQGRLDLTFCPGNTVCYNINKSC